MSQRTPHASELPASAATVFVVPRGVVQRSRLAEVAGSVLTEALVTGGVVGAAGLLVGMLNTASGNQHAWDLCSAGFAAGFILSAVYDVVEWLKLAGGRP